MTPASAVVDFGNLWLFSGCSRAEHKLLEKSAKEVTFPAGKVIMDEGEVGRAFYVIVRGKVAVVRKGRKAAELGPGQLFGEISLL
ncbi:MAG TPA: cyclic nucleotide-binding domain-containing protein, partial [Acidimicrobiales bacterium]|nr:cyclic nucleotide-binding domain-containing protein [Acidimicrobiales bacterium]